MVQTPFAPHVQEVNKESKLASEAANKNHK